MPSFTDKKKQVWDVELDVGTLTKIRHATGIHLGKILGDQKALYELLYDDMERLGIVLFTILEPQAEERGIDGDAFARGLDGKSLNAAREALAEAITNFTQPPKTAATMAEGLKKLMAAIDDRAATMTERAVDDLLTLSASATNSPGSAASMPAP